MGRITATSTRNVASTALKWLVALGGAVRKKITRSLVALAALIGAAIHWWWNPVLSLEEESDPDWLDRQI